MFGDPVTNPMGWNTEPMEKVAPTKVFQGEVESHDGETWLLNLDMVEPQTGRVIAKVIVKEDEIGASTVAFNSDNVLYSKLRPYLNKVVLPDSSGFVTTEMIPLLPDKTILNRVYLTMLLRGDQFVGYIKEKVAGTKMPRVQMEVFKKFQVILPPIDLQHHFAEFVQQSDKSKFVLQHLIDIISAKLFTPN